MGARQLESQNRSVLASRTLHSEYKHRRANAHYAQVRAGFRTELNIHMGRHKLPTAIRELEGNPSKRPLPKEPAITASARMPRTLTPAAKIIWKNLVKAMPKGVFLATDTHLMSAYCEQVAAHDEAVAMIFEHGSIVQGSTGQEVASPWVRIRNESANKILALGSKLGLSPTDRMNLPSTDDYEENPFLN